MKPSPRENLEVSLSETQRHPVTVDGSFSTDERGVDEIDRMIDDMPVVDPYECHAPSRRSNKDLGAFLDLLDSLETGNDRKEPTR